MSLLPYHKGNKTIFINLLFTLTLDLHFIARPRYKETAGVACGPVDVAGGRDAATLGLWRH